MFLMFITINCFNARLCNSGIVLQGVFIVQHTEIHNEENSDNVNISGNWESVSASSDEDYDSEESDPFTAYSDVDSEYQLSEFENHVTSSSAGAKELANDLV